eukprot:8334014-Pyramimonas_sp.AAC.1
MRAHPARSRRGAAAGAYPEAGEAPQEPTTTSGNLPSLGRPFPVHLSVSCVCFLLLDGPGWSSM